MNVLVIGADGFLGQHLIRHFTEGGHSVSGIGSASTPNDNSSGYRRFCLPLESPKLWDVLTEVHPDVCIYAAGGSHVGASVVAPREDFNKSVPPWLNLLEGARVKHPRCRHILLSSAAVYGNPSKLPVSEASTLTPISPYGYHKRMMELAAEEYAGSFNLPITIVRIFSAYGEGLRKQVIWDLTQKAKNTDTLKVRGKSLETRDFIHASDVAAAIALLACQTAPTNVVYNIASGTETSIKQVAEWIVEESKRKLGIEFDGNMPQGIPVQWRADISRLTALGWKPAVPVEQGMRQFIRWCMANEA